MDITSAAIASVISSLIATTVAIYLNRHNHLKSLNDQLDNILKIALQFPYLESKSFISGWLTNKDGDDELYLRYDIYCTLLFNFLERYCKFYKYNVEKIHKQLNVKDWVAIHRDYWESPNSPNENVDSYEKEFQDLINSFLN